MKFTTHIFVRRLIFVISILVILQLASGCGGIHTYPNAAKAGDTVTVAAGWKKDLSRNKITVTITPSVGPIIEYAPGDPAVRAVINLYPDPVSSLVVSTETDQDLTENALSMANLLDIGYTHGDKDYWQTTVFIDLPDTLPLGITTIDISSASGESVTSTLEIIDGVGQPEQFLSEPGGGPLSIYQLAALERVNNYQIQFDSTVIPYAIQAEFSHLPDLNNGGIGKAHVANPRGDLKNITWTDDGSSLKVILMPSRLMTLENIKDFKFYVAGGIDGLTLNNITAFDIDGGVVSGVTAEITSNN